MGMLKKSFILTMLFAINFVLANQLKFAQAYPLGITVTTDKSVYNVGQTVKISGNVTYYSAPVSGVLVALQINDRALPYAFRTLYTGTPPSGPWYVEVTNVYIGDSVGNPVTSLKRGDICYVWIYYQNTYRDNLDITIAFTIYDVNQSPLFAQTPISQSTPPGTGYYVAYAWQIPTDAEPGDATVYASAFTGLPVNGGTPHSPEKSYTFGIRKTSLPASSEGTYSNSFQIARRNTRIGNYNVYVASFYQGYQATYTTSYQVILQADINGDLYVNIKDAVLLGLAYGSKLGDPSPPWDPRCDLNHDNYINIKDAVILGTSFGTSAI